MFRTNQHCSRYEETPIQVDTPIIIPTDKVNQNKSGIQFIVNDRSSYFDWFSGFFEVKFTVNKKADGTNYNGDAKKIATTINSSTSLINNLNIKQNGKVVFESNNLFLGYIKLSITTPINKMLKIPVHC